MSEFDSITHFLQTGGFNYRVYDMGRKIIPLSNEGFEKIEKQGGVYPYPLQQKAWLALILWREVDAEHENTKAEPVIWFLQFPIDELGFLKLEARDAFLIDLLEQAGKNIQAKQSGGEVSDELGESPFAFKPQPDRLALFHALSMNELGHEPSQYYKHTQDYLSGDAGYEQWQFLGLQGIADVVARLDKDNNEQLLAAAISELPETPLESFCQALESVHPKGFLAKELVKRLKQEVDVSESGADKDVCNIQLVSMLARALSGAKPDSLRQEAILDLLSSHLSSEIEVLAAISARAWDDLKCDEILRLFIDNLANQDQRAFNAILSDLMMIPRMRELVMDVLRSPDRSNEVSQRLSGFMVMITGSVQ